MAMTSRQRVRSALRGQPTDRVPVDLGSTPLTGIAAGTLARLRKALGLRDEPVKVDEPYQVLGRVEDDLRQALGVDTIDLASPTTLFGYRNDVGWKPWKLQDGTDVLISNQFQTTVDKNGDTLVYPRGDRTAAPSGRLPKGGYYFDAIVRQQPLDEDNLDPDEFAEQFGIISDADLELYANKSEQLYRETDYAIISCLSPGALGDIAFVPATEMILPKGPRDPALWYEFLITHTEYVRRIFEIQTEIGLKNLELYRQAVGDRIEVMVISGTDFGTQRGLFVSPDMFRDLWKPFYKRINDWVHQHTDWKTFYHTCGSVRELIDDFIDAGADILNPVQCSAEGMDPQGLKDDFGDRVTFWGGGVDTQKVLPFGTPDEVRKQVAERVRIFSPGGRFVFNTIHNIQHGVPVENIVAMFDQLRELNRE